MIKIILITFFVLTSALSFGQSDTGKDQMKRQLDSLMKEKLINVAGIDAFTSEKLIDKYKASNKQIRELKKEKRDVMNSIESNPSAPDVGTKLDILMKLESDIFENRRSFMEDLRTFLTPRQIAETMVFMKDFSKEFRKKYKKDLKKNEDN